MSTTDKHHDVRYQGRVQRHLAARRNAREIDRFLGRNLTSLQRRLAAMGWTRESIRTWIASLPEPDDVCKTEARAWSHEPPAGRAVRVGPPKKARARPASAAR